MSQLRVLVQTFEDFLKVSTYSIECKKAAGLPSLSFSLETP